MEKRNGEKKHEATENTTKEDPAMMMALAMGIGARKSGWPLFVDYVTATRGCAPPGDKRSVGQRYRVWLPGAQFGGKGGHGRHWWRSLYKER
jgi:hypothetical protein